MSDDGEDASYFTELPLEIAIRIFMLVDGPHSALRLSLTCQKMCRGCTDAVFALWVKQHLNEDVIPELARQRMVEELSKTCYECDKKAELTTHNWRKDICSDCAQSDRYRLLPKTQAMKDFRLSVKELDPIRYIAKQNPRNRNLAQMRLYPVRLLQIASDAKHAKKGVSLEAAKAKAANSPKRPNPKIKREATLRAALEEKGLELRYDSEMCSNYIKTGRGMSVPDLVNLMMRMHLIHEHSVYQEIRYRSRNQWFASFDVHDGPPQWGDSSDREYYYYRKNDAYEQFNSSKSCDEDAALKYIKEAEAIEHPDAETCSCGHLKLRDYILQNLFKA